MKDLYELRRNIYSQNGEDGILGEILSEEGIDRGYFLEFGAGDGKFSSNCANLMDKMWKGCFIEGDGKKFHDLNKNIEKDGILKLCHWVQPEGVWSLDSICASNGISRIDVLSIDIDGDDLACWGGLTIIKPTVVIIEHNPTIPADVEYINPRGKNHGNSALAIQNFAIKNGYTLIDGTLTNLIFVKDGSKSILSFKNKSLTEIRSQTGGQRYFFGYDGTLIRTQPSGGTKIPEFVSVPWTSPPVVFPQPLPKHFRYMGHSTLRAILLNMIVVLVRPIPFLIALKRSSLKRRHL